MPPPPPLWLSLSVLRSCRRPSHRRLLRPHLSPSAPLPPPRTFAAAKKHRRLPCPPPSSPSSGEASQIAPLMPSPASSPPRLLHPSGFRPSSASPLSIPSASSAFASDSISHLRLHLHLGRRLSPPPSGLQFRLAPLRLRLLRLGHGRRLRLSLSLPFLRDREHALSHALSLYLFIPFVSRPSLPSAPPRPTSPMLHPGPAKPPPCPLPLFQARHIPPSTPLSPTIKPTS